ncbi:MAG: hypothetical protein RLZZ546_1550 [Bacteroidota bacterium]
MFFMKEFIDFSCLIITILSAIYANEIRLFFSNPLSIKLHKIYFNKNINILKVKYKSILPAHGVNVFHKTFPAKGAVKCKLNGNVLNDVIIRSLDEVEFNEIEKDYWIEDIDKIEYFIIDGRKYIPNEKISCELLYKIIVIELIIILFLIRFN